MRVIDLTLPLYSGMPVYPGDPEASIEKNQTLEKDGWEMRRIEINSHDGTHVNAQVHAVNGGKTLDKYPLELFCGSAYIYSPETGIKEGLGVVFRDQNIDQNIAEEIKKVRPRFVGLACEFEIDTEIEKDLLKEDIILFERLANTKQLPNEFTFYGVPLNIKQGDGSPVRAFAMVS